MDTRNVSILNEKRRVYSLCSFPVHFTGRTNRKWSLRGAVLSWRR